MKAATLILGAALLVAGPLPVAAQEPAIELRTASGSEIVQQNCGTCHSLDYIQMNAPIQDKEGWTKTVDKMVKVFGAPVEAADQTIIIGYLAANYGK